MFVFCWPVVCTEATEAGNEDVPYSIYHIPHANLRGCRNTGNELPEARHAAFLKPRWLELSCQATAAKEALYKRSRPVLPQALPGTCTRACCASELIQKPKGVPALSPNKAQLQAP